MKWEVARAEFESPRLSALLSAGWEPFSATGRQIWLRRDIDAARASAPEVTLPWGPGPAAVAARQRTILRGLRA